MTVLKLCSIDLVLRHSKMQCQAYVDGASVNFGVCRRVGAQLMEKALWLHVIHCFNHKGEVALKDVFMTIHFRKIEQMLLKLYCLYQKSPKRMRELQ